MQNPVELTKHQIEAQPLILRYAFGIRFLKRLDKRVLIPFERNSILGTIPYELRRLFTYSYLSGQYQDCERRVKSSSGRHIPFGLFQGEKWSVPIYHIPEMTYELSQGRWDRKVIDFREEPGSLPGWLLDIRQRQAGSYSYFRRLSSEPNDSDSLPYSSGNIYEFGHYKADDGVLSQITRFSGGEIIRALALPNIFRIQDIIISPEEDSSLDVLYTSGNQTKAVRLEIQ